MYKLGVDISEAQMKRLHKGKKVRVKKGKGFELMVHPMTYNIVTKAFDKGKGSQIQLSPDEITMNKNGESSMDGTGVGDITLKDIYKTGKYGANKLIDAGVYAGESYQNYRDKKGKGVDEPAREPAGDEAVKFRVPRGTDPMSGYRNYRYKKGKGVGCGAPEGVGRDAPVGSTQVYNPERNLKLGVHNLKGVQSHVQLMNDLNKQLGTNYGYLARAGMDNALANKESASLAKMGIDARYRDAPVMTMNSTQGPPSRAVGGQLERSSVGRNGGMISSFYPPALVSQPFSANFQFQHFLPPQYQHFNMGGQYDENDVMGNGLYV